MLWLHRGSATTTFPHRNERRIHMRVWLYYRLSRDDDAEQNSLTNQRNILVEYAKARNHEIVGESFDDNVSGMTFDREGIEKIYEQFDKKSIDAVVVKDLSRLGRHRTQTMVFIDELRRHNIRVLSVTENIDSFNEADDLTIGFKGIINDMYCKDTSRRISAGYLQKQREGIVLSVPLGYFKDKNTDEVVIIEEEAEIVRRIYDLYLQGYGLKSIADKLNSEGVKSPLYYQTTKLKKKPMRTAPKITKRFLWNGTTVKRVLTNGFYKGTLVCHKTHTNKIYHTREVLPVEENFVHEDFVPAIISKEKWEQVQTIFERKKKNVRASSGKPCHRYTGLLRCEECGCNFVCKIRRWAGLPDRYEYNCTSYHRYGKNYCTPHRINESMLDELIYKELLSIKDKAIANYQSIETDIKRWMKSKSNVSNKLDELNRTLRQRMTDQEEILLERIRDKEHTEIYTRMLKLCEDDIERLKKEIAAITDYSATIKKRKAELKESVDLIEQIIQEGAISDANLRLLVDSIVISEKDKKLHIKINLNAKFDCHTDCYDAEGNLTEKMFIE